MKQVQLWDVGGFLTFAAHFQLLSQHFDFYQVQDIDLEFLKTNLILLFCPFNLLFNTNRTAPPCSADVTRLTQNAASYSSCEAPDDVIFPCSDYIFLSRLPLMLLWRQTRA